MTPQAREELIALVLDGRPGPLDIATLTRAIAEDADLLRLLRQHLIISEVASQMTAPERSADSFIAGMWQRHLTERDAHVYTARVMSRIRQEGSRRGRAARSFALEIAGMSAAALLLVGLMSLTMRSVAERIPMDRTAQKGSEEAVPRLMDHHLAASDQRRSLE
ncbi:MAG: hypothetical protein H0W83_07395 [Planctomycetes bacterium]|nr:hypothetical protein [Planctomycetota bacterium]